MSMREPVLQQEEQLNSSTVRPFGLRDKVGYLLGDFGNDFFFLLTSTFLMVFYTDIFHISAATVGVLFMVARLWDAFADVAWGRFIDTRPTTKNGKFKPWILRMSFPLVFTGVLMFTTIPGMSDGFYLAWAFVTYIVWGTLYSTVNIPYGSMASVITADPVERTTLSTWRTVGASLAGLIINVLGPMIVFIDNKISADRMFMTACIFGVLAIACYIGCYKLSTERIEAPAKEVKKGDFLRSLKSLVKNKPFLWVLTASLMTMLTSFIVMAVNTYLFKDYFGNAAALSIIGLVQMASMFITVPLVKPLVAKFGKKEISIVGMAFASVIYIALFFLKGIETMPFIAIVALAMMGMSFYSFITYAFISDVIDYHEYLTSLREDATVYSIVSMSRKIGQAVAGGIGGVAIAAVGYNATLGTQPQEVLDGIYMLGTLVPGVLYGIIAVVLFMYPLNKQKTIELSKELEAKRNANS
ncbi:MFS transporter [Pradoshia sp. D12]|uniref:MFS transporter n=1 Tax=Bacillaceae TaxID=186817 RepID=UPI00080ADC15|nr:MULTISPECIES: glycoside-pentoside-hexuronide (GPH):cation symporter [Bacillaceae]OCA80757.1 sugar transporter [Bacillus sp. FJAT-27986]QFK70033.1 MFS transporter [Pradoshia sp. D12]TPF70593.1 MFS transporter [Bacillus sp. D12]